MSLMYNTSCPPTYEPMGFIDSTDLKFHYPDNPALGWSKASKGIARFDAGSHSVAMAASYLERGEQERLDNSQIPSDIGYQLASSRLEDLAISKQLQQMQRSSSIPANHVDPTQTATPLTQPPRRGFRLGTDPNSRRQRNVIPEKVAELIVQAWGVEIHNHGLIYLLDKDELEQKNKIYRIDSGRRIHCQCNSEHEESDMVSGEVTRGIVEWLTLQTLCHLCGSWQHDFCYGYKNILPEKRPKDHFCYSCLLLPRAQSLNDKMPELVRMRIALICLADFDIMDSGAEKCLMNAVRECSRHRTCTFLQLILCKTSNHTKPMTGRLSKTLLCGLSAKGLSRSKLREMASSLLETKRR